MKDERYNCQIPIEELQRDYFLHFNFNYWMHKAKALLAFIEDPSMINKLRFEGDNDSEETIVDNLKMDLHMMVFHSSETLFLNLFSIANMPQLPWIWISRCSRNTFLCLVKIIADNGLVRIHESHKHGFSIIDFRMLMQNIGNYEKSRLSTDFVIKLLKALALSKCSVCEFWPIQFYALHSFYYRFFTRI